ncbi:hypothetical protein EK0264_10780 [Epidermidibacterium keratini]|uniref:Glycosyltransferase RgtA/B/C/D-like domain-containing protein n=1 Tax=Epidermidibacterium keratini TaxID=1891644 RepID=A0A7L4YN72_9ACTN|nr:glycosyltransferase family 39 protein [Epidermidibacterium keratini]QHC00725.1 hypothetical protein EK0264_10780 [Epidermidibacterium keratini]
MPTAPLTAVPLRSWRIELRALAAVVAAYAAIRTFGLVVLQGAAGADAYDKLRAWDGAWFIRIATEGYPSELVLITVRDDSSGGLAFFPLYPMLMRALASIGLEPMVAGLVITVIAGIAAAIGIYAVAREVLSPRAAFLAVLLWAALPMSIVLSMVYSEALFTALAAWALWASLRERWLLAGVLGFAAGLTRSVGIAVGIAVTVAAILAWRRGRRGWRPVAGSVVALAGVPTWWVIVAIISGRVDGWFAVQDFFWGSKVDFGADLARVGWQMLTFSGRYDDLTRVVYSTAVVAMIVCGALAVDLVRRALRDSRWAPLATYAVVAIGLAIGSAGFVHSKVRFIVPVFVLVCALAGAMGRWSLWARVAGVLVMVVVGAWWSTLMLTLWPYAI